MFGKFSAPILLTSLLACAPAVPPAAATAGDAFAPAALVEACEGRSGWSDPAPPAHLFGNTWMVGTCGITVVLVTSDQGHVLIDSGPDDAAPLVAANIARLGYRIGDVKLILSSHEHYDHVGGMAELQRLSGAPVAALAAAAPVLASGKSASDDPQHIGMPDMAPITVARVLRDGELVKSGPLTLTAFATPTHSPGSTSWAWTSCDGADCRTITYADSNSTLTSCDYRFTDHPDRIRGINAGLARIAGLPCGILITPHPGSSDMFGRFTSGALMADPAACKAYAARGQARFEQRLASEAAPR
jgi:metallo-beta-lactamase class B